MVVAAIDIARELRIRKGEDIFLIPVTSLERARKPYTRRQSPQLLKLRKKSARRLKAFGKSASSKTARRSSAQHHRAKAA